MIGLFRLPNAQLEIELQRMDTVMTTLSQIPSVASCDGYRLNTNPFFLKLCKRIVFNPDDAPQVDGMYILLDYWKILSNSPQIHGLRGGRAVSYKNVRRYFDNSSFVSMVSNSWIGSAPEQSIVIEQAIRATLELGKAVMIAVKSDKVTDVALPNQASSAPD